MNSISTVSIYYYAIYYLSNGMPGANYVSFVGAKILIRGSLRDIGQFLSLLSVLLSVIGLIIAAVAVGKASNIGKRQIKTSIVSNKIGEMQVQIGDIGLLHTQIDLYVSILTVAAEELKLGGVDEDRAFVLRTNMKTCKNIIRGLTKDVEKSVSILKDLQKDYNKLIGKS